MPDTRPDPLADAATILGIVLSTSLMSDKHVEECIEAARPLIAHIEALGWTLSRAGVTLTQPQPDPDDEEAHPEWCRLTGPHNRCERGTDTWLVLGPQPDAGLREAAQPFLEAALDVFPEDWISPGSSYAIAITVRGSEVDALRDAIRSTPAAPKEDDRD